MKNKPVEKLLKTHQRLIHSKMQKGVPLVLNKNG